MIVRVSNLEFDKWPQLRDAIDHMIDSGTYSRLVTIHSAMVREPDGARRSRHRMHGLMSGPLGYRRFLPWHRAYLIAFEKELRKLDESLSVPFWDWPNDAGRLVGFRTLYGLAWGRELGLRPEETGEPGREPWFATAEDVEALIGQTGKYYDFAKGIEDGLHNAGHRWIGGAMNSMESPADPAFWFHHAQVDRIWARWQELNPGEKAQLSGRERRLDPWQNEFDIDNINDISHLGTNSYTYN